MSKNVYLHKMYKHEIDDKRNNLPAWTTNNIRDILISMFFLVCDN